MTDRSSRPVSFAQFSALARRVAEQARGLGLVAPGFRTPPKVAGADRTLRRPSGASGGDVVVAVRLGDRGLATVAADLVEGVVAANRLTGDEATKARAALLAAISLGGATRAA